MEIGCRVYRPRRPRESPLHQLVERHLEQLLRLWPTRFVRSHGPLRAVAERVLREFPPAAGGRSRDVVKEAYDEYREVIPELGGASPSDK